jgi:hypothetical protein
VEPYQQRLRTKCFLDNEDDDGVDNPWPLAMAPKWRGSSSVPEALLQWLLRMLGIVQYDDDEGLHRLSAWEWQQ